MNADSARSRSGGSNWIAAAMLVLGQGCTMVVHIHAAPSHAAPGVRGGLGRAEAPVPRTLGAVAGRLSCGGATWFSDGSTGRSWSEARAFCEQHNGELASIRSADEQRCVETLLVHVSAPGVGAWVGLHEQQSEGAWRWVSAETAGYANWLHDEPNNDSGGPTDCGHVWRDSGFQWNDIPCSRTDPTFVCRLR